MYYQLLNEGKGQRLKHGKHIAQKKVFLIACLQFFNWDRVLEDVQVVLK
jgi:hypothetical protein